MPGRIGGNAGNEFRDQGAIGFGSERELFCRLVDGEIGGEVAQAAAGLGGGDVDFLLGGGHNAGAFFAEGGLDALFVFEALLLNLGAEFCISCPRPASLASTALRRAWASAVAARAVWRSWLRVWERLRMICGMIRTSGMAMAKKMMAKLMPSRM